MALRLKIGTVMSQGDLTQSGQFKVAFKLADGSDTQEEPVRYVTPYGNNKAAFVGIPTAGSQVLVAYEDSVAEEGGMISGYYYLGSLMGNIPGLNKTMPRDNNPPTESPSTPYVSKDKQGFGGPSIGKGKAPMTLNKDLGPWPERFKDLYDGKAVYPEKVGLTTMRGDTMLIANRYRGEGEQPFQDHRVSLQSGSGKRIELVDSPMVDGIVMTNEHRGKDYMIWSTGLSAQSPFAAGEVHWRTHGPFNLYTLLNRFHVWVEDGLNVEIENKSTGEKAYGDTSTNSDGRPQTGLGNPGTGGYVATREGVFGNETTGCIQLWSHHNNVSVSALEQDSVIHLHAPGPDCRVIVDTGGSVDIVAQGKITLQSDTEVEINAPEVDINALGGNVYIDGTQVHLNQPHPPPQL